MAKDAVTVTPPAQIDGDQLAAILAKLTDLVSSRQDSGISAKELETILEDNRRALYPSDPVHSGKSPFDYPEGSVAATKAGKVKKLDRIIFFNGSRQNVDDLTPQEVDAWNEFSQSLPGPNSKRLARSGTWTAEVTPDNQTLKVLVPCNTEDLRLSLPSSLRLLLREFLDGPEATDPNMLLDGINRIKALEAQLAALVGRQPVTA